MRLTKAAFANTVLIIAVSLIGLGQDRPSSSTEQWKLVKRATFVIDYQEKEFTVVSMVGTHFNSKVSGRLEVQRGDRQTQLKLFLYNLPHPQNIGVNYTSYLIWVIARNGQVDNLGRVPFSKDRASEIELTTPHRSFGLIVTAEPHPLVNYPSPLIVAENLLDTDSPRRPTQNVIEYRGDSGILYAVGKGIPAPLGADYETPLNVLGARRAVEIARRANAGEHALAELRQAESRLVALEKLWRQYLTDDSRIEEIRDISLEVMQIAEAARAKAVDASETTANPEVRRN